MSAAYLNGPKSLPTHFRFPAEFLEWLEKAGPSRLPDWKGFATERGLADGWFSDVRGLYPTRSLVPFAQLIGTDDIACFDGEAANGEPIVHLVHAYAETGWEDRGSRPSFAHWLGEVQVPHS